MTPQKLKAMPIEQRFRLFVQWLGNQPEHGTYRFASREECAMCQFARTLDVDNQPCIITAGLDYVSFFFAHNNNDLNFRLVPLYSFALRFGLDRDVFGKAYNDLAPLAGLPVRSNGRFLRFLARFVKHKQPLAA